MDDSDIDSVENYIKFNALKNATDALEQSIEGDFESVSFCLQDDQMTDIFGEIHASNPSKFKFERGDRIRIRCLVDYVKDIVDGDGNLKGLGHFEIIETSIFSLRNSKKKSTTKPTKSIEELKSELHRRVLDILKTNGIHIDATDDNMVEIEPNGIFGLVHCIACKESLKKNPKPKRVYYKSKANSGFWVVANFDGHLKRVHKSIVSTAMKEKKGTKTVKVEPICTIEYESNSKDTGISNVQSTQNEIEIHNDTITPAGTESIEKEFLDIIEIDSEAESSKLDEIDKHKIAIPYVQQISAQITRMVTSVIMNGDAQTQMNFQLKNDIVRTLSVVKMPADGNCLFSALSHQQYQNPSTSKEHSRDTSQLRADVCNYILNGENFPKFQYQLKDRVYELKAKAEIYDMEEECKQYVRNVLSKSGEWGGMETIKAASEIFESNIIVIQENESCYITRSAEKTFDRTIIIAYRYMHTASGLRLCHYDSVSDMDPASIWASANALPD